METRAVEWVHLIARLSNTTTRGTSPYLRRATNQPQNSHLSDGKYAVLVSANTRQLRACHFENGADRVYLS